MKKIKDYDDNCPIDDTLKLISKKWVIFIIRDLFLGKKQFSEFLEEKTLSNRVLTDTLKFMEENDLIRKEIIENDIKTEYYLTQKGYNLNKILYEMLNYGLREVNSGNLSEKQKNELLKEYESLFKINDKN
ncbi:MAG: helix-turn-helix transcriptional regulator [Methanobrevibacter sp.]|uniref:winged helix-turn-helix transcriptional regulator n=1 Tax=Methanobrevibacter sp. TaxID=66852 RepID=UPI0025D14163|nr:helix-turn-helix domain-containing protein [Methanobrevibacter sp.]MBQ6098923.1 helix-turn-helix transcriptional regulator [Methanobrevibacter sp.]